MTQDHFSIEYAKHQMVMNMIANALGVVIQLGVTILITKYLIYKLGLTAYGIVVLANSFLAYVRIASGSFSTSISRFLSVSYHQGKVYRAQNYFSTSFIGTIVALLIILPLSYILLIVWAPYLNVPDEFRSQYSWLLLFCLLGLFWEFIATPIRAIYQIAHCFVAQNIIQSVIKIIDGIFIILLFAFFLPRIWFVGLYQAFGALLLFVSLYFYIIRLQSCFRIGKGCFSGKLFKNLWALSSWDTVQNISGVVFFSGAQIIASIFSGTASAAIIGTIIMLGTVLLMCSSILITVFTPIIYQFIGSGQRDELQRLTDMCIYASTWLVGLPSLILIAFTPFILKWLLSNNISWDIVLAGKLFLLGLFAGGVVFQVLDFVFKGFNKVKFPSLFNLSCSILFLLSCMMISHLNKGFGYIGLAFFCTYTLRGIISNALYYTLLLKISFIAYFKKILWLLFPFGGALLCTISFSTDFLNCFLRSLGCIICFYVLNKIFFSRSQYVSALKKFSETNFAKNTVLKLAIEYLL